MLYTSPDGMHIAANLNTPAHLAAHLTYESMRSKCSEGAPLWAASSQPGKSSAHLDEEKMWVGCRKAPPRPLQMRCSGS